MTDAPAFHSRPRTAARSVAAFFAGYRLGRPIARLCLLVFKPVSSQRCSQCRTRWPEGWERCPRCRNRTIPNSLSPSTTQDRALQIVADKFEAYYEEHKARRKAEGHDPEAAGRREARAVIRLDRQLGGKSDAAEAGPAAE